MTTMIPLILAMAAMSGCPAPMDTVDCFDAATLVPPDVDSYIHISDGAGLRRTLARGPSGEFLLGQVGDSPLLNAWKELAGATRSTPEELFDALLGDELTLAFRRDEQDRLEWGAVTKVSDDVWEEFNRRARPKFLRSRQGVSIRLLPEQSLLFARSGSSVLIGPDPANGPSLFEDMLSLFAAHEPAGPSLASTSEIAEAGKLSEGNVGVFIRHRENLRGWSAAVLQLNENKCEVEHVSEIKGQDWADLKRWYDFDAGLMTRLAEKHLIVAAVPLRSSFGPFGAFVRAQLPADALNELVRSNLRKHLLVIVGSRHSDNDVGVLIPFKSVKRVAPGFDRTVIGSIRQLRDTLELMQASDTLRVDPGSGDCDIRSAPIGDITQQMFPTFDPEGTATLHWVCRDSTSGSWAILATSEVMARGLIAATDVGGAPLPPQPVYGIRATFRVRDVEPLLRGFAHNLAAADDNEAGGFVAMLRTLADAATIFDRVDLAVESIDGRLRTTWRAYFAQTNATAK